MGTTEIAIRERRAHPHRETLESHRPAADAEDEEQFVRSEALITTSSFAADEGGARRRRPGSRRSTSARTVYAGADLVAPAPAADLPPAPLSCGSRQWQSSPSLADDAKRPLGFPAGGTPVVGEPTSALPGRPGSIGSAGDPQRHEARPGLVAGAARSCSTSSAPGSSHAGTSETTTHFPRQYVATLRPSPLASAGVGRETPAAPTQLGRLGKPAPRRRAN